MCRAQSGVSSLCTWRPWARVQRPGHQQYQRRDGDARCLGNGGSGDAVEIADSLRTADTSNRTTVKYMCAHVCGRGRQAGGVAPMGRGRWVVLGAHLWQSLPVACERFSIKAT